MKQDKKVLFATTKDSYFAQPITRALEALGFKTEVFDYYRPNLQTRFLGIGETLKVFSNKKEKSVNQALLSAVRKFSPQYLLVIKGEILSRNTIKEIHDQGVTTINWFPDWLISWNWVKKNVSAYDVFINSCLDTYQKLKQSGVKNDYLPYATEPDIPRKKISKKYSIVFIGQHSPRREQYFQTIKHLGLHIWGYAPWRKSSLADRYCGQTSVEDTKKILRQSKIVVNILTGTDQFQPATVNVRTFETLGVGTMQLVKYHPIFKRHFKVGREIVTFTNKSDLRNKVRYYLAHEQERERIATAGYNRVLEDHTFEVRLKELFKIVKNHEQQRP